VLESGAVDPLVDARTPTRQSRLGPEGAGPRLTVWASTISAQPGETVTLFASLAHVGAPTLLDAPATSAVTGVPVSAQLIGERLGTLGAVTYRDDGVAPDSIANDGVYTAAFTLPSKPAPALGRADSVLVKVSAALSQDDVRMAAGGFQFSRPAARLTGRYTDAVRDGNLVVAAEVEALAPGRVHVSGTLADTLGAPFATAQASKTLAAGKQWVELTFYGLAFHERAISGPVRLASIAVTSTAAMPNALGAVATNAHTTKSYLPALFRARPFNDAALLDTARRLQLDAAR